MRLGHVGFLLIGLVLLGLLIFAIWHFGLDRITSVAMAVAVVMAPFGLLAFGQAAWRLVRYRSLWQEHSAGSVTAQPVKNDDRSSRILWLIFDEMDESAAFEHRQANLSLPELDRLRSQALSATNAYPPAGHTSQSIPALLTGKLIASVTPAGPNELMLKYPEKSQAVPWSKEADIFTTVRANGLNTNVIGWYHPYCRVIGDRLSSCSWEAASQLIDPAKLSPDSEIRHQEVDLLSLVPYSGRLRDRLNQQTPEIYRVAHLNDYRKLLAEAKRVLTSSDGGLTFVHLPVPHPPYIYDRNQRSLSTSGQSQYGDNLALADVALGELRQAMERAEQWDRTAIIVSSDHWWRKDYWHERQPLWTMGDVMSGPIDHRVPFIIKLPGQQSPLTYQAAFNTVLTHDLILALIDGRVSRPAQVTEWLDQHRTIGESPYQTYEDAQE
jgi:hypothetical protein